MKFALIGAAALTAAAFATPALAQAVIEDPGYCAQFYPNANCQTLYRAIRTPMAATIATTGRTATRPWNIVGTVTTGCTAGNGRRSFRSALPRQATSATGLRVCLRSIRQSQHHSAAQ